MPNPTNPALSFTKARNGGGKILIVVGRENTFDPELVEKILRLGSVSQPLYDPIVQANGCGMAMCLRIDPNASPHEVEDAIAWAIHAVAHEITEHHEWDKPDYDLNPEEILWRRGAPFTTRW